MSYFSRNCPYVKKCFKTQLGRILIVAAIGHKKKIKNVRVWGNAHRDHLLIIKGWKESEM